MNALVRAALLRRNGLVVLALLALGCRGPSLTGATAVLPDAVPRTDATMELVPADCRDSAGAPAGSAVRYRVVSGEDGREVLIEERAGYDSIVIHRRLERTDAVVFEFSGESNAGPELRRTIRIPRDGSAAELIVTSLTEAHRPGGQGVALACRLDRGRALE